MFQRADNGIGIRIGRLELGINNTDLLRQSLILRRPDQLLVGDLRLQICRFGIKLCGQLLDGPGLRLLLIRQRALLLEDGAASFPVLPVTLISG